MNWWVITSAIVVLATPTVLGLYDLGAYELNGNEATISRISQRTAWAFPPYQWSICFLFGVLCGHLFVTQTWEPLLPRWVSLILFVAVPYLLVVVTMVAGLEAAGALPLTETARAYPLASVLLSLAAGALVGACLLHQTGD